MQSASSNSETEKRGDVAPALRRIFYRNQLFWLLVLLPTLLGAVYYGLIASDVYVSESRFVVRSQSRMQVSPLGALLSSNSLSGPSEETNAVIEYIQSRDALASTDHDGLVRNAYGAQRVNCIDRFGGILGGTSQEHLFRYFGNKFTIETDPVTQVATLTVRAFDPQDARKINMRLLEQSESLVNQMSNRARGDAIEVAEKEFNESRKRARQAASALAEFRQRSGIVDPNEEAEIRLQMISKLQSELIATRTQLQQMRIYTPRASQIPYLRTRQASLEQEIVDQTRRISGGDKSLSEATVRYQELFLDSRMAEKQLEAKVISLEEARADARRKRAYVERVASPSLPDYAMEPLRMRGIISVLLISLLVWGIISTLLVGVREHRA